MRSATKYFAFELDDVEFQSTHPVRGATAGPVRVDRVGQISIHAPREGCDLIAVGLVFNAGGVKDVLLELFNKIIGA